jgi:choline dehydrogenase-like flavoprotein
MTQPALCLHDGLVTEHYDVIIVGSGAGGGTLAHANAEAERLYAELKKILNHTGMAEHHVLRKNSYMDMSIPVAGCAHQAGTCRFGTDPATSVLDVNCKAHELDNLYIVDTSFIPSIGAVNPALTAMANAIRVGEHLLGRMS